MDYDAGDLEGEFAMPALGPPPGLGAPPPLGDAPAQEEALRARVLYDFTGHDSNELNVFAGQEVSVISRDVGDGWWRCSTYDASGLVPETYLELI